MTTIWLAGAENPAHHILFSMCETDQVAINVGSWKRNYSKDWSLKDGFLPEQWVAWTDSPATVDDLLDMIEAVGSEPYAVFGSEEWSDHPNYCHLWDGSDSVPKMTVDGPGLVVTDNVFSDEKLNKRALASRKRGTRLGVVTGKSKKGLERYDFVVSSAWWSAQKHGETQLWDGDHFHRVNASKKLEFRNRHAQDIEALGVDIWDVLDDSPEAVAMLAIKSWMAYSDSMDKASVLSLVKSEADNEDSDESQNADSGSQALDTVTQRERHVLPVMNLHEFTDEETGATSSTISSASDSLKRCDNCHLADICPEFQQGASCAFSLPVKITTRDQLVKVMQTVVEVQTQRIMQMRFAEELQGQEHDKQLGVEMDRLYNHIEKMRDIMDNRDSVSISIESRGEGGGGVLSRLFGANVGQNAQQLDRPMDTDDVVDAVVEDES